VYPEVGCVLSQDDLSAENGQYKFPPTVKYPFRSTLEPHTNVLRSFYSFVLRDLQGVEMELKNKKGEEKEGAVC